MFKINSCGKESPSLLDSCSKVTISEAFYNSFENKIYVRLQKFMSTCMVQMVIVFQELFQDVVRANLLPALLKTEEVP